METASEPVTAVTWKILLRRSIFGVMFSEKKTVGVYGITEKNYKKETERESISEDKKSRAEREKRSE